jgi:hypothetical protein
MEVGVHLSGFVHASVFQGSVCVHRVCCSVFTHVAKKKKES